MAPNNNPQTESLSQVGYTLRTLTANLIGIVRGYGKPLELSRNLDALNLALAAFESSAGRQPRAWELAEMLRVDLEAKNSAPKSEEEMAELYALHAIVQASLQLAATRVLGQEIEATEAHADLRNALRGLGDAKRKIEGRRQRPTGAGNLTRSKDRL